MSNRRKKKHVAPIYTIAIVFLLFTFWKPIFTLIRLAGVIVLAGIAYAIVRAIVTSKDKGEESAQTAQTARAAQASTQTARRSESAQTAQTAARTDAIPEEEKPVQPKTQPTPKYPPEVQAVVDEGEKAHAELTRLYASIPDLAVKRKIQEIIDVSDKIVADAVADPSDVPQIKKFLDYYLPTTIKLLNSYDRMCAQGIKGKNITRTMDSINEMLDTAIDAYKKLLDSLFANQAMDVETDIQVMNTLLRREGFTGGAAFQAEEQ